MKKLLFIPILLFSLWCNAQMIPISLVCASTLTDLRGLVPGQTTEKVDLLGLTSSTDGNGGIYSWNSSSTTTDDGFITIQVTGITTGRWLRVGGSNTIKGTVSSTGIALTSSYTVSYSTGTLPFTPISVLISARSFAAAGPEWVSSITATGFTVNFIAVPVGTISFDFVAIKQ